MDSYKDFDFNCTDPLARVNSDVLIEQVNAGNEPILEASAWVRGIWIWIGVEFAILVCLCICACGAAALSEFATNIRDNCDSFC